MVLLTSSLVLFGTIVIALIYYLQWCFKYWERKSIPCEKPGLFKSLWNALSLKEAIADTIKRQYDTAKTAGYKHFGSFIIARPLYIPIDPQIVRRILTADFTNFINRGIYYNKETDPLSAHLFALEGQEWKNLRVKLTPTFTSGKMKMMIHSVTECGKQLNKAMDRLASSDEPFDAREPAGQFTTDVIGSCAFGLDCNSFENPNSDFIEISKRQCRPSTKIAIKGLISSICPQLARKFGMNITDDEVSAFFMKIVRETIDYREQNNITRNDFMQLLINLKNEHDQDGNPKITFQEVVAQAFLFFVAGYETSSSTMAFFLYEMAVNLDVQDKVRGEIKQVLSKHDGELTYDAVMELKYMEQAIDETLRKHPPLSLLARMCVKDYKLPETNEVLEKGTLVFIPTYGLHYDPEYYPDPEKFDPERFSAENKSSIDPNTYLPFGEGPRNCIGLRFGIMQVKIGLANLLKDYQFSLNEKTITPLKLDPTCFMLTVLGGIWLNASKIS